MSAEFQTNNKRIAKNAVFLYIRMAVIMLVQLYTARVTLNVLGVEDYGIYNIVGSFIVIFTFISGPLNQATQRFINYELGLKEKGRVELVYNLSLYIYAIFAVFLIVACETIGLWYVNNKMQIPAGRINAAHISYQFYILTLAISLLKTPSNSLVLAHEKMSYYAYISIIEAILKLVNALLLQWIFVDKLILFSFNHVIIEIILISCLNIYCRKKFSSIKIKKIWDAQKFKELLGFSGWSLFGAVAGASSRQGLNILLNLFFGVVVNAAMGVSTQISSAVNQFVTNFQTAFRPQIVKYYATQDFKSMRSLIINSSKYSYLLLFMVTCPFCFNAELILSLWLGKVPEYSLQFTTCLLIYALIEALAAPLWMAIQATGKIKSYQIKISVLVFLNFILSYIFLKLGFYPLIVLEIKCIIDIFILGLRLIYVKKGIELNILDFIIKSIWPVFKVSLICIISMLILRLLVIDDVYYLFVSVIVFLIVFIATVSLLALKRTEREKLVAIIKKHIK